MKRGLLLVLALFAALFAAPAWAQDNPVFNASSKSWIVRYGGDTPEGNKKGDICVQLQITSQGGSNSDFVATIYRYDSVALVNGQIRYKKRGGPEGKQTLSGSTVGWDATKPRKPVRFAIEKVYQNSEGLLRKLKIWGVFQTGKDAAANKRNDNRLAITLIDIPHVTAPPPGGNGSPTSVEPPADNEKSVVAVAFYKTLVLHPCEEDPDIDILEEDDFHDEPLVLQP